MRKTYKVVNGELVEIQKGQSKQGVMVVGDIEPYTSMIDGTWITSRSHHREHLKAHGCVEVGNDSSLQRTTLPPVSPPKGLKEAIARQVYSKLRY